jgi:GMP synthase-like glutamine amidotransferase
VVRPATGTRSTSASPLRLPSCLSTLAEHSGVVIFGGPMSANDKDEFIRQEIG